MDHENIVKMVGHFVENKNLHIILEFAENGNLFKYIKKQNYLSEPEVSSHSKFRSDLETKNVGFSTFQANLHGSLILAFQGNFAQGYQTRKHFVGLQKQREALRFWVECHARS